MTLTSRNESVKGRAWLSLGEDKGGATRTMPEPSSTTPDAAMAAQRSCGPLLLVAQHDERVAGSGSPRRQPASEQGYRGQQSGDAKKSHRVGGRHADKKPLE